ncbi:MAG: hypothetical protein LQ338_004577 [Usnochroma carphineum]|nr:MAG: hypothetical protein LQ338_004577 [Usnochroma carphineum]
MSQSPPAPPAVRKGLTAKEARRINSLETIHPNNVSPHIQDSESIVRDNGAQTINSGNSDTLSQLAPEEKLDETTTTPRKRKIFKPVSLQPSLDPSIRKCMNHSARRHKFVTEQSLNEYTTSQRRAFERDVYDYARSISLTRAQAKASIIDARGLCGEEDYYSDDTRLDDDEVDDSSAVLLDLPASSRRSSKASHVLPSIQAEGPSQGGAPECENSRKRPDDAPEDRGQKKMKTSENTETNAESLLKAKEKIQSLGAAATTTLTIPQLCKASPQRGADKTTPEKMPSRADGANGIAVPHHPENTASGRPEASHTGREHEEDPPKQAAPERLDQNHAEDDSECSEDDVSSDESERSEKVEPPREVRNSLESSESEEDQSEASNGDSSQSEDTESEDGQMEDVAQRSESDTDSEGDGSAEDSESVGDSDSAVNSDPDEDSDSDDDSDSDEESVEDANQTKVKTQEPERPQGSAHVEKWLRCLDAPGSFQCRECDNSCVSKKALFEHLKSQHKSKKPFGRFLRRQAQRLRSRQRAAAQQKQGGETQVGARMSEIRSSNGPLTASRDFQNPITQQA